MPISKDKNKILLFLDYDGTLVPIKKRPELAQLPVKNRLLLQNLSYRPNIRVAIISGRQLSDIKSLVGIPKFIYIGNHGYEIDLYGKRTIQKAAKRFVPVLKKIKAALAGIQKIKGAIIDDKKYTLSIHFRQVRTSKTRSFQQLFFRAIRPWRKHIKLTSGKKVFEIRPPGDWNKGRAAKWVIKKLNLKKCLPIYIGDDKTDEDAFMALKKKGIPIQVGKKEKTAAACVFADIETVYQYLRALAKRA